MNIGLIRAAYRFSFFVLSLWGMLAAASAQAQSPTISASATGPTTLAVTVGNVYSWRIEEKVGGTWSQLTSGYSGSPYTYIYTRAAGTYTFRAYSCYPTSTATCNYSSTVSVTLTGNNPPANPTISSSMSGSAVLVSWSAPSGTSSYQLTRNGTSLSTSGNSYTDSSVAVGTAYSYTIKACNAYGCSSGASTSITTPTPPPTVSISFSPNPVTIGQNSTLTWSSTNATSCSEISGTTATSGTKVYPILTTSNWTVVVNCTGPGGTGSATTVVVVLPPAPTGLNVVMNGSVVNVSWTAASGATSYQLTKNGSAITPSGTGYTDTAVSPNTTYTYAVKACNANGCSSPVSASITPPAPIPSNPSISATMSGSSVYVSWSAPTWTTSYQLVRNGTSLSPSGASYTDASVSVGTSYTYTVKACNATGCSSGASTSITPPLPTPATPTITANFLGASISVNWSAPSGTHSYQFQRNGSSISSPGNSYIDTSINGNASYTYSVRACNATGQCSSTATATASTPDAPFFQVNAIGPNTIRIMVGNVYSWSVDEQVAGSWTNTPLGSGTGAIGTPTSFTISRPAGTHTFRLNNCYPVTNGCSTSSSRSASLVGTAPPATPTLTTAMSGTSVLASWNSVAGAASYELKRNGSLLTAPGTSYTDSAVTPGTTYSYALKACNATGECSAASTSTITPPAIPATPTITPQFDAQLKAVVLSWTRPAGTYDFRFRRVGTVTTTNDTSYTDTAVSSGSSYAYGIRACNSVGQCSGEATANVAIPAIPAAPSISAAIGQGVINVSWTAPAGTSSYQLMRGSSTLTASGTAYADSSVVAGTSYTYSIKACNVIGDCSTAASTTITYPDVPATPQLTASVNGASVVLTWSTPVYAITYQLKRGSTPLSVSGNSHSDPAVVPGNSYTYTIKACNSAGLCSAEVSATISVPPLPAVPTVTAIFKGASVLVSWNAPTGATSYQVQRNGTAVSTSGTSYTDTSITQNASYTYTVKACNANNQCSVAGSATASIPAGPFFQVDAIGPNTIQIMVGNVYSWSVDEQVAGSWTNTPLGSGTGAIGSPTSFTISRPAGTHTFRLNNCYPVTNGCSTSSSKTIILIGETLPENPLIELFASNQGINITWTAPAHAASYELRKNTALINLPAPTASTYIDNLVSPGETYTYTVKACNSQGYCSSGVSKSITLPPAVPDITLLNVAGGVFVSWTSSTNASSYEITRNSFAIPSVDGTHFLDTNVVAGQEYSYSIKACNAENQCSSPDTETIIYTPNPSHVPSKPVVTASFMGASVAVKWPVSPGATSYKITHTGRAEFTISGNTYEDTGIYPGTRTYSVKACNINDQCSEAGTATESVPSGPYFQVDAVGPTTIRLLVGGVYSWQVNELINNSWVNSGIGAGATSSVSSFTLTRSAGRHSFQLYNCYSSGQTPCSTSSTKSVTLQGDVPPSKPSISAVVNGSQIDVSWTESAGAESYRLKRDDETLLSFGTSYIDTLITPGEIYTYKVAACTASGGCSQDAIAIVKVPAIPPVPVITAEMSGSSVFVSWTASEGAHSYKLFKGESTPLTPSGRSYTDPDVIPGNSYTYSVKACNSASVCSIAGTVSITVPAAPSTDEMVNSPLLVGPEVNDPAPREKPTGPFVGSLKGDFRVNEMGAATYTVPIAIPDGIAGVTPQLSLMYSSQAGNGLLGKGWGLNGLSSITRCRQTLVQDGQAAPISWSASDRFCLDGKRLMLVSSGSAVYGDPETVYKTEIDTFVTVIAKGGTAGNPDYFEVTGKDGSVSTYGGNGSDSSELLTAKGVLTWGVKNFQDNVGNPIVFVYEGDTTNYRVKEIRYAFGDQNPASSACGAFVAFGYEPRTYTASGNQMNDYQSAFVAGVEIKNTDRLVSISAYNGACSASSATLARLYKLDYSPGKASMPNAYASQISAVSECVSESTCYPATNFEWSKPNETLSYIRDLGSTNLGGGSLGGYQLIDINGNGMADMVWSNFSAGTWHASYALDVGSASGFHAVKSLHSVNYSDSSGENPPRFLPIDYNGDARQDLLVYSGDVLGNPPRWRLYLSTLINGGWELREQTDEQVTLPFTNKKDLHVADINSDGLNEVVGFYPVDSGLYVYSLLPRFAADNTAGNSSNTYYQFSTGFYGLLNEPASTLSRDIDADNALTFADFNGDGKMDVAIRYKGRTGGSTIDQIAYRIFVANNNYQFEYYATLDAPTAGYGHVIDKIIAADINGDGLADTAYFLGKITCQNGWGGRFCEPEEGNWYFRLNTGDGFAPAVLLSDMPEQVVFADINHDGKMDFVTTKKKNANYKDVSVRYWNSATNNLTAAEVLIADVDLDKNYQFADTNGDSWLDSLSLFVANSQIKLEVWGHSNRADSSTKVVPSDQIFKITDGLGNITNITYSPLGRSDHYSPLGNIETTAKFYEQVNRPFLSLIEADEINEDDLVASPVIEVIGPVTIVNRVEVSAPSTASDTPGNVNNSAKNSVDYYYRHLRMQAGGRGMLGFESLKTIDAQTDVKTETRYRQDWPYIGSPLETIVQASDGKLLSRATNKWDRRMVPGLNNKARRYQPYIEQSVEETFAYNSDGSGTTINSTGQASGSALQTVTTDIVMSDDDFGNTTSMTITTEGGGDVLVKTTINEFGSDDDQKRFGRLQSSSISTTRNNVADSDREVSFTYYPFGSSENGLLWTETLEGSANEQLVTTYTYDDWGNKTGVNVEGSNQTRTTTSDYGTNGRYLVSTSNGLAQVSTVTSRDPATGQASGLSDINSIAAEVLYDDMGREYLRVDDTGAWTRTDISNCSASSGCPASARYVTTTQISGGAQAAVYYDSLGRAVRNAKVGFDGTWIYVDTEYDSSGRVKHQSTPYFSNNQPAGWTSTKFDFLGRIKQITLPDGSFSKSTYSATTGGIETVTTNSLSQTKTELHNGLGQLVKVTDHLGGTIDYTYTIKGDLLTATTDDSPAAVPNVASVTVKMCYDGLGRKIAMNDPDKGGLGHSGSITCSAIQESLSSGEEGVPSGWWLYNYNAFGELVWQHDPKGQETTMIYDTLGRMIFRRESKAGGGIEAATTWVFDKPLEGEAQAGTIGKLTAMIVKDTRGGSGLAGPAGAIDCQGRNYCSQTQYDELGRPQVTLIHLPDGQDHITTIDYDSIGRAYQSTDVLQSVFSSSGTQTQFNDYGYAYRTVDMATMNGADSALSTILSMNARGQVTEELRSNGAITVNTYNEQTGLLTNQNATVTGLLDIQDNTYEWDALGNLTSRISGGAKIGSQQLKANEEGFCYDGLNRLVAILPTSNPSCGGTPDIEYDGLGNITKKVGVGDYVYDRTNGGPHAVTSVNGNPYRYDLNGNAVSGDGRTFEYTSYDMVKKITKGLNSVEFKYGPDHARWQRIDSKTGTTTTYLGNIERITKTGSNIVEWKRTVAGVVHTYKTVDLLLQASGHDKRYLYTDHLGSVDAITDAAGSVTHSTSFDAWGARRSGEDWSALTALHLQSVLSLTGFDNPVTTRGYTGHEMVDDFGIIHMNGRIYDPRIGRFLQADPFIQAASNTQSYNRYSYVMNNPLNSTDPSGYFSLRQFVGVIVAVVLCVAAQCSGSTEALTWAGIGAASGAAQAAANGGNILLGAVTGFFAGGLGGMGGWEGFVASATFGGATSYMMGGKFGHGFISAGISSLVPSTKNFMADLAIKSAVGGTVSKMTGGKFANGAVSAAVAFLIQQGAQKIGINGKNTSRFEELSRDGKFEFVDKPFDSPDAAAEAAYLEYEEEYFALKSDEELLGTIVKYRDKFYYYKPTIVPANTNSVAIEYQLTGGPEGVEVVANYHTHPAGNLNFSGADLNGVNDPKSGVPMYLRNMNGDFKILEGIPLTGRTICSYCFKPLPQSSY